jgi:phosphatidate cytidylyltransferase
MLLRRAVVVFTFGPLALLLIYLGGWYYFVLFGALLGVATWEFTQLAGRLGWRVPLWLILPFSVLLWFSPDDVQVMLLNQPVSDQELVAVVLLLGLMSAMAHALWLYESKHDASAPVAWLATAGGMLFLGWLGSFFFRLRSLGEMAAQWTALAMLGTWIADSGAYVFGKSLGKHKLAPRLSPNKAASWPALH